MKKLLLTLTLFILIIGVKAQMPDVNGIVYVKATLTGTVTSLCTHACKKNMLVMITIKCSFFIIILEALRGVDDSHQVRCHHKPIIVTYKAILIVNLIFNIYVIIFWINS